jgi:hypothetical protein
MSAVARLVWTYFTGTVLNRVFTIGGLALLVIAGFVLSAQANAAVEMVWIAILGHIALFIGGSLMSLMFGRLAKSHSIRILPYGRVKLLLSAFVTIVLVSAPSALLTPLAFVAANSGSASDLLKYQQVLDYSIQMAWAYFTGSILMAGWLYIAIWFVAGQRNAAGMFKGLAVVAILMFVPPREIDDLGMLIEWQVLQIAVMWAVFGAGFMLWPRFKAVLARHDFQKPAESRRGSRAVTGREFDLLMGTANPWLLIAALVLPSIIATRFIYQLPSVWLYFLTLFSIVVGAFAGQAAERSRVLWLRGDWSRGALFSQVERSYWRHNGIVLASLLLFMIAIGLYAKFPAAFLAAGLPLLVLGTLLSTYNGLMITRGLRWSEATLGCVLMCGVMLVAMLAARRKIDVSTVAGLEVLLAALVLVLRAEARRRWLQIDWTLCRPDRALAVRGA